MCTAFERSVSEAENGAERSGERALQKMMAREREVGERNGAESGDYRNGFERARSGFFVAHTPCSGDVDGVDVANKLVSLRHLASENETLFNLRCVCTLSC